MRDAPSADLTNLLARLGLASPEQLRAAGRHARRLARDLPLFDSVWVDALMRRRALTPFQAAEINAGRGAELAVGPVVLLSTPERLGYADEYPAARLASGELVRVLVARWRPRGEVASGASLAQSLQLLAEQLEQAHRAETATGVAPLVEVGFDGERLWAIQPYVAELSLREALLRGGRLPGPLVLEIARQMAAELADLERFSLVHGDLSTSSARIDARGKTRLALLGCRSALRPREGYAHADLAPEAYDYLAPERVAEGTLANTASDLYACGCLWWRLLTGRAPLAGGDSLTKIKAVHAARVAPLSRLAPETPALLASAIEQVTRRDPAARGESFAELASQLGPASPESQRALAEYIAALQPRRPQSALALGERPPTSAGSWSLRAEAAGIPPAAEAKPTARLAGAGTGPGEPAWWWRAARAFALEKARSQADAAGPGMVGRSLFWRGGRRRWSMAVGAVLGLVCAAWWAWNGRWSTPPLAARTGELATNGERAGTRLVAEQVAGANPLAPGEGAGGAGSYTGGESGVELAVGASTRAAEESEAARQAAYAVVDPASTKNSATQRFMPVKEVVLPSDRLVSAATLELHPGMRLFAAAGGRAKVLVPAGGWNVDAEDVRFENIDFVIDRPRESERTEAAGPAVAVFVRLAASAAEFHGCSFVASAGPEAALARHTAIEWRGNPQAATLDRLPSAGRLTLANCFLANLSLGVDGKLSGPVVLELDNVLFAAAGEAAQAGPLWRLEQCPASEDTVALRMNACTVRGAMSLIDLYCGELPAEPGRVQVEAVDCIFAPRSAGALLRVIGPYRPDRLLRRVAWGGRGSLLPLQGRFALWYDAQGSPHALDDAGVEIDGLVRGVAQFAGERGERLQDSQLTHWAAPLIGDVRPGVRLAALPRVEER